VRAARRIRSDEGMVTAETAVVLPVLVVLLAFSVWALACVSAQLRCVDAARVAARLAARGDSPAQVQQAGRAAGPPGAAVEVGRAGDQVVVLVRARVQPFGPALARLPAVEVHGRAAALDEASVLDGTVTSSRAGGGAGAPP
jgi:TadE-like protein